MTKPHLDIFRFSYTFYGGNLRTDQEEDADWTRTHVFQADRYYGEKNYLRIGFTTGREQENIPQTVGLAIRSANITNGFIQGRQFFGSHWALVYMLKFQEQGDFYDRYGGNIGLRYVH